MEFLTAIITGLSAGGTYAIIALGYTMVYGIAKMLNFAHGDIIMAGGYMMYIVLAAGGHPLLGLLAAIAFCVVLGVVIEKLAYKPLRGAASLAVLITAIGMSYLLQSVAQIIFGSSPKILSPLQDSSLCLLIFLIVGYCCYIQRMFCVHIHYPFHLQQQHC